MLNIILNVWHAMINEDKKKAKLYWSALVNEMIYFPVQTSWRFFRRWDHCKSRGKPWKRGGRIGQEKKRLRDILRTPGGERHPAGTTQRQRGDMQEVGEWARRARQKSGCDEQAPHPRDWWVTDTVINHHLLEGGICWVQ